MISEFFLLIIQSMSLQLMNPNLTILSKIASSTSLVTKLLVETETGMVAVYAFTLKLNSFNFVIRLDLNMNDLENLCLEIQKPCSKPFLLVTWYRPPCSSAELFSHYETLIGKLDSLDLEYYLMGDFNCNMASAHFDSNTRLLCEISDIYGLQQLITEPTRITESSSSLIDVIFTNCINRVVCSGVLHIGISDHSLIYVYRKLSPEFAFKGHSTKTYRNFSNFNRENFRRDISRQDWSCTSDDPNFLWTDLPNCLSFCQHMPAQTYTQCSLV